MICRIIFSWTAGLADEPSSPMARNAAASGVSSTSAACPALLGDCVQAIITNRSLAANAGIL